MTLRSASSDTFRFLRLSSGGKLKTQTLLAIIGTGAAVYGDVVKPFRHAMLTGTLTSLAVGVIAWGALVAYARKNPLTQVKDAGPGGKLLPEATKYWPERGRDLVELAAMCFALFLLTWGGERVLASWLPDDQATDSVSVFATLIPPLERLRSDVAVVRSEVAGIRTDVREALGNVKKEVSDDPRKELTNIGVAWSGDAFLEAVRTGDLRVIRLFVAGGIPMVSATSQGRPLPVMLALNEANPGDVLGLLVSGGLDVNHIYQISVGIGRMNASLLSRAIEKGNIALVKALLAHAVNVNGPIQTVGAFGMPRDTYPLASAVMWQRTEIAALLLDNGADAKVGDYAAYREAQAQLQKVRTDDARRSLNALAERLAPAGADSLRVGDEQRLRAIDDELTRVALESMKEMRGSARQVELDRRYDELQREKREVKERLGPAAPGRQ